MKVILINDIPGVGKKYEVKEVKNGHARNFLIPQNLVKPANKENMNWLAKQKKSIESVATEDLKKIQELASKLDGAEINISVKIGDDGQLFESVTVTKIAEKLKEAGFDIRKNQIELEKPIKETGEFPIKVSLDHNLESEITVIIKGEEK
jgi:large subunit ribosomal protein L9